MKKLMIAAAAAAMIGGAFAADLGDLCKPGAPVAEEIGCSVWNVKFSVKTLAPKALSVKGKDCDGEWTDNGYYYENGSRTLEGILWQCTAGCSDDMNFALWEKKTEAVFTDFITVDETNKVYVAQTVANAGDLEGLTDWAMLASSDFYTARYSKKANKVEALWPLNTEGVRFDFEGNETAVGFNVVAAGLGTYDAKLDLLKSVSGNFAGLISAMPFEVKKGKLVCGEEFAKTYFCEGWEDWVFDGTETEVVVAYGTWSVKYNKSAAKKPLVKLVPDYVFAE